MIVAGLQLHDALRVLAMQDDAPKFGEVLDQVVFEIERGKSLSKAMSAYPDTFSDFEIFSLHTGFESGRIEMVLRQLSEAFLTKFQVISKVKSKVTYPAFLLVVCLNIAIFLPPFLFGRLFDVARNAGQELPWISRLVGAFSDFVRSPACLLLIATIFGLGYLALSNRNFRTWLANRAIGWPGMGPVLLDIATLNFCRAWMLMQDAGLPLQTSLPRAASVAGNATFTAAIDDVARDINEGLNLSEAFQSTGLFSTFFIAAMSVGVETGQLTNVLETLCELKEEVLEFRVDYLTALLEPFIMILLGGITGVVAIAAILPIAQMISNLG